METALIQEHDEMPRATRERWVAGDKTAFGELVEGTMRRAYRAALALVGSPEDALDLSQEAFARAYRARSAFDPSRPFYPWYYQILRRLCFNFLRDRRSRRQSLDVETPWLVENARRRQASERPDRAAELGDLRRKLQAAIASLPEREREIFALRELEGLRYAEMAELLDIPIGTVMSRLYSARRRLTALLEDER